jgi:hypothetical protein
MIEDPHKRPKYLGHWRRIGAWLVGLWRRLLAALRGPEPAPPPEPPPPPPPPGRLTERRELDTPIVVPARGYVFDFHVYACFIWTSDGLRRETLSGWAQHFMTYARRELQQLAADLARNYSPHRVRELEVELKRVLATTGTWRYERHGTAVGCRPQVRVQLDDRVKQFVRPYWERRIKMECEHEVEVRRAELAEQLSRRWLTVLEKLAGNPLAGGAAKMTEKEFAVVVEKMLADQKDAAEQLHSLLEGALKNSAEMGAYERAETLDLLVEQLRRQTFQPTASNRTSGTPGRPRNGSTQT